MGKTGKWIKYFLIGKKDKEKSPDIGTNYHVDETLFPVNAHPTTPISVPSTPPSKEKRRWSFRRSSTTTPPPGQHPQQPESEHKKHALGLNASPDAALVVAKPAPATTELTSAASVRYNAIEDYAAIKIQSFFRGYLSRKALNALRGLVKLQALVRGHLVRKQAVATLRCMQALITLQSRARAQRLHMVEESKSYNNHKQFNHRKSAHEFRRHTYQDVERGMEENVKIVEMDPGDSKPSIRNMSNSYNVNGEMYPFEHIISTNKTSSKHDDYSSAIGELSPSPSPRANSGHFEDYSFNTAQSSPQYYPKIPISYETTEYAESNFGEYPQLYPSYMANTKSSRAKVRSHSAPKSRPESYERQNSGRRRISMEGRNVPRGVKMQRSSSQVAAVAQNYHYPWSVVKLDKSAVSLKDSECGSSSTVLTNANYCRSLVGFEVNGNRY